MAATRQRGVGGKGDTVEVRGVSMVFGQPGEGQRRNAVLHDIDLTVHPGQFTTIIGPSGCGKTTLLNCIGGLLAPTSGHIHVSGLEVDGPAAGRAMVFQHPSLLPWRNVQGNIAYGLQLERRLDKAEIRLRVADAIRLVGLEGYEGHYPHQISGGMQQRCNLARALATEPSLLLLDEPFGALDAITRSTMQDELSSVVAHSGCTTVFITHDIEEAVYLADVVVVLGWGGRMMRKSEVPLGRPRDRSMLANPRIVALVGELRSLLEKRSTPVDGEDGSTRRDSSSRG